MLPVKREGLLVIKGSIAPQRAAVSQIRSRPASRPILAERTSRRSRRRRRSHAVRSGETGPSDMDIDIPPDLVEISPEFRFLPALKRAFAARREPDVIDGFDDRRPLGQNDDPVGKGNRL